MWVSPDGKIHKLVLIDGVWGKKPAEQTECEMLISECPESLSEYTNSTTVVIGHSDNHIRRILDICLTTMNEQETAKFRIRPENISFTMKLIQIKFNGYIHEWDAKKKIEIAQDHKEKGVALFKQGRGKDAAYRFVKALKIMHSIPINAENVPEEIDNVPLTEINKIKANLYSNLASYYLKNEKWLLTIKTCKRVFDYDEDNIKAHYKLAVAYIKDKDYDKAKEELDIVLAAEPTNKAAAEHMNHVNEELHKAEVKFNLMVKKMFT